MYLHHIGILDEAHGQIIHALRRLGYTDSGAATRDEIEQAGTLMMEQPDRSSFVEMIWPTGEDSHLRNKPIGLHHLCFVVADLEEAVAGLRGEFIPVRVPHYAPAFGNRRTAWVASRSGLLIELLEE